MKKYHNTNKADASARRRGLRRNNSLDAGTHKGGKLMKYIVICTLYNGKVIHSFASTFKSATNIANMYKHGDYTSSVEIITLSTEART